MLVRRKLDARRYKTYTDENLKAALTLVSSGEMSLSDISAMYNILKSTLSRKNNKKSTKNVGHSPIWTKVDERLKRHKDTLIVRLSENIKLCRSGVDSDIINNYFDELKVTLKDVKPDRRQY